jgi:hypothetical protein
VAGRFAEGRFAEGRFAEGRFAEGRFAEGRLRRRAGLRPDPLGAEGAARSAPSRQARPH